MNQNIKILEVAKSCTIFDFLDFNSDEFCVKNRFLNALLNRWDSKYTQNDVADRLGVSKRTVINLEKGKIDKLTLVLNYIHYFGVNNAEENAIENHKKYMMRKTLPSRDRVNKKTPTIK